MNNNLADILKSMRPTAPTFNTSPQRKCLAVDKIQKDEPNMDAACITTLVDLFKQDIAAADIYLALFREDVQRYWIEKQLTGSLGFPPLSPMELAE